MQLNGDILYKVCQAADFCNPTENLRQAQHLIQLMMKERGVGLAANQAGVDLRLFVMFVDKEIFHCFNPQIIDTNGGLIESKEGCLSFPGEICTITRHSGIVTEYYNARGRKQQREFHGLASRCFQHELDHLNGVTMYEREKSTQS